MIIKLIVMGAVGLALGLMPLHSASYSLTGTATQDSSISLIADTDNSDENDNAWVYFSQDDNAVNGYVGFTGNAGKAPSNGVTYSATLADSFLVGTKTNHPLQLGTNGNARVTVESGGNVGIGVTDPQDKLHVTGRLVGEYVSDSTSAFGIRGVKARGTTTSWAFPADGDYLLTLGGGGYNGTSLYHYDRALITMQAAENWTTTANGTRINFEVTPSGVSSRVRVMTIDSSGMVGIGTNAPTHALSVNGAIRAKEIIVDTGWADYVFASNYRLAPLSEVEQHIKEKGHLPDVPSAKEISEKGVSVGESQALLLRKVEELTLHLIAQEKEMARLRSEVVELKASRAN